MKLTSEDVKEQMYKLAKKGLTPSQIGKDNDFYRQILGHYSIYCIQQLSLIELCSLVMLLSI